MNCLFLRIYHFTEFILSAFHSKTISLIYSRFSLGLSVLVGFFMHSCIVPHIQMSLILVTKLLIHLSNTNFLLT